MKININIIKEIPGVFGQKGYCVHDNQKPDGFMEWLRTHGCTFHYELKSNFWNFTFPEDIDLTQCFIEPEPFQYVDGFSPNLNKHLHLGHLSNFVLAKSLQSLGVGKKYIANLGDTLEGGVEKQEAFNAFTHLCLEYGYKIDDIYFATNLTTDKGLTNGEGDYAGTKIFDLGETKIVGIKSDGSTTYFLQDVALAENLNGKTLYMTGGEQAGHFKALQQLYPNIEHLPLGLVLVDGKKMASREGNVIYASEIFAIFKEKFGDNPNLIWNVLCGYILKSNPTSTKDIKLKDLDNVKTSFGLYLSYTLAKLNSAGLHYYKQNTFHSVDMQFAYLKAKYSMEPNVLLKALVSLAKDISGLYEQYRIKDTPENHHHYVKLAEDLLLGMSLLGMKYVEKV